MTKTSVILLGAVAGEFSSEPYANGLERELGAGDGHDSGYRHHDPPDHAAHRQGRGGHFTVGPEVARFNEFKVGDKVKMTNKDRWKGTSL